MANHPDLDLCARCGEKFPEHQVCDRCSGWPDRHLLEAAWGLIANAHNWQTDPFNRDPDWVEAATKWRDAYHRYLDAQIRAKAANIRSDHGEPRDLG